MGTGRGLTFRRWVALNAAGAALLFAAAGAALAVGASSLSLSADWEIIRVTRLPRVLLSGLVGACLAMSGAAFQSLFRNPLADPFILGISSGGGVGAVLAIGTGLSLPAWLPLDPVGMSAFAGALLSLVLVYLLSLAHGIVRTDLLLLVGVILNAFFSSLLLLATTVFSQHDVMRSLFWLRGGFVTADLAQVKMLLPFFLAGFAGLLFLAPRLNVVTLGQETASALGIHLGRLTWGVFFAASLATGASVAVSGIIGFIGLLAPHGVRTLAGPDNRLVIPGSAWLGAVLLIAGDTASRTLLYPVEIPVGVLTALLGAPFFLLLLRSRLGRRYL